MAQLNIPGTVDATGSARAAFDVKKITRRFYDRFKTAHTVFLTFVKGIRDYEMQSWYASVMINRLMFIYFIQKKGFLDNNPDYLRSKLAETKKRGRNLFYAEFLCALFFKGLAEQDRSAETRHLLGDVPCLNGGLFIRHQIEELHGKTIEVPDAAFEKLFDFFDAYQWHLDERPLRDDRAINPDVLGYIFEKYINQKQMGAYYTKEDITEYISKNTIIPCLFDKARKKCGIAFEGDASVWRLLQEDPDKYIHKAVRHGVTWDVHKDTRLDEPRRLPPEIAAGLDIVSKRSAWNKSAPPQYALPKEIWREVVARRGRYGEVRDKLASGEVRNINDLITCNLDIRQFAQDLIKNSEEPDLLRSFWHALAGSVAEKSTRKFKDGISILDPACGSGAFLFAALNILEPLYDACLDRMEAFLDDLKRSGNHRPETFADFRSVLERVSQHPNRRYFILKSIIISNLFGVDIMEEAVEICRLRLFLKLVAQVDRTDQIERLPDIDFNIRAGNTLIGYATLADAKRNAVTGKLAFADTIEKEAEDAGQRFNRVRQQQIQSGVEVTSDDKRHLRERLNVLEDKLSVYLAGEYGIKANDKKGYERWLHSHKPFHWIIEFHSIMRDGGFDVVIGNPPYVSAARVRGQYGLKGYVTESCSDIYANFVERGAFVLNQSGRSGMILPLSLTFSRDFGVLRDLLYRSYSRNWFSSFARIPAALFSADVRVRNTIHIGQKGEGELEAMTTVLHRWFEDARPHLFQALSYANFKPSLQNGLIPKMGNARLVSAFENNSTKTVRTLANCFSSLITDYPLYFKRSAYNWLCFCRKLPPCYDALGRNIEHTKFGVVYFTSDVARDLAFLFLNGKVMFLHWCGVGDDFDLTRWMFADFHVEFCHLAPELQRRLLAFVPELEKQMNENVSFKLNAGKRVGNYNLAKCRSVTDRSDQAFIEALGLQHQWEDIELMYTQMIKTSFE